MGEFGGAFDDHAMHAGSAEKLLKFGKPLRRSIAGTQTPQCREMFFGGQSLGHQDTNFSAFQIQQAFLVGSAKAVPSGVFAAMACSRLDIV
jgi:hypothetical protein